MKKVVLVALNSSYSHTNLALRYIRNKLVKANHSDLEIVFIERTINEQWLVLLDILLEEDADIYAFSCYIWNRILVESLSKKLKELLPETVILWGGPDVSSQAEVMLKKNSHIDGLIKVEGDSAAVEWIEDYLDYSSENFEFSKNQLVGESEELNWHFPYTDQELKDLSERILYYEGSRGCAYNCTYCLSANTFRVRHKALDEVYSELNHIMKFDPRQLKFIDRTFNSDPERAYSIWQFLIEKSAQLKTRTNFHFEIAAELMTAKQIELLSSAKAGLFQFEIGAQTTNPAVLEIIRRPYRADHYKDIVRQVRSMENIHIHLDLIAGLPGETLKSQIHSANELLKLYPNMLQMGFLKVLPDTQIKFDCDQRGMIYQDHPPYEILESDAMTAAELMYWRKIENIVNLFYNSGHYFYSISFLLGLLENPFTVFTKLYEYFKPEIEKGKISRNARIDLFYQFAIEFLENLQLKNISLSKDGKIWVTHLKQAKDVFRDLLSVDYFSQGLRGFPDWLKSLHQSEAQHSKELFQKANKKFQAEDHKLRARFELFNFSLKELPGIEFAEVNQHFSGAGEVQPTGNRILSYLKKQVLDQDACQYVCALKLGQGPFQIISEYSF